jgi:hypothetical protein
MVVSLKMFVMASPWGFIERKPDKILAAARELALPVHAIHVTAL